MPQKNLIVLLLAVAFCYACYLRGEQSPHARYTSTSYRLIDDWALDDVPEDELYAGAVNGMIDVLNRRGDEHSRYITKQEANAFQAEMRQQFGGIGVRIRLEGEPSRPVIVGPPEPGTPAFHADIRPGDVVLAIDGLSTENWDMLEVLRHMRGKVGDPIELEVLHQKETEPVNVKLVREVIMIDSILGDQRAEDGTWIFRLPDQQDIALVRIIHFGDKTVAELEEVLEELTSAGISAVILDLRDNSGGGLEAAVQVCDLFLEDGQAIVETRGRDRQPNSRYIASGTGKYKDLLLAVLINENTASASEIVAACLQDHQRAAVIGQRSFGKGTVQKVVEVGSRGESLLKLTTASYWRPSGANIHRMPTDDDQDAWGVQPDESHLVPLNDDEYVAYRKYRSQRDLRKTSDPGKTAAGDEQTDSGEFVDQVLERAVAVLQQQLAN